ncbi:LysR substrate-binding domain-containing protein [Micromonospora sp. DR5-3]|uniref:LysR family transcriptional regulator n=1 Tax=unclassified Micromonospora TaxID=2617518 RepID=UPI0011D47ED0|nr:MULTISPECIES: LysR substrate-binding domain-containing protein [unclassified Micromonospora]MCW3815547.1 LysR substrate-binding domain-containing protein [Micromonospora sp. DR5-3]TYC19826.1 LysR family transcriptional regulator [Micromonospora sp. MP36]
MDLLRHLRHFVVVARELHFGRAAEVLGMAQPPLSQSIQRLERELGVALFDRSQRQVRLTTAGQLLLGEADDLLAGEQRLRNLMGQVRRGALGVLRAGVPPETPAVTLRALLDGLAARAPGLDVDLHELTSAEQQRMLAEGRLDVGLLHHPVQENGLRFGPAVDVPVGVLLPRASPLARTRRVDLAELAGLDLITAPRATAPGWHDHLLAVCRQHGFAPDRVRHARNPEFLFGLVLAGGAVAVEPEAVARREPRIAWRPISGAPLVKRTSAAWPDRAPHPAAPMFGQLAAEVLAVPEPPPGPAAVAPAARPWPVLFEAGQHPVVPDHPAGAVRN